MTSTLILILSLFTTIDYFSAMNDHAIQEQESITVKKCNDFTITGKGDNREWGKSEWIVMEAREKEPDLYKSCFKIMYSDKGIYVLFDGEDKKISTALEDFSNVWEGDVFEVFFHTDLRYPLYFEYEINPLNSELVLIIPNIDKKFLGWLPWHYEGERKVKKAVYVKGGKAEPEASIKGWLAELFFPYELLTPMGNVPPESGTEWKANFYRMDYDRKETIHWSWVPVTGTFHDFENFGTLRFE